MGDRAIGTAQRKRVRLGHLGVKPLQERALRLAALEDRLESSQSAFAELRQTLRLRNDALRGVPRINNLAEHRLASAKRKLRRRLGHANLGRDMQDQPAQAALAANLLERGYVRALWGAVDKLPKAFANHVQSGATTARLALDRDNAAADLRRGSRASGAKPPVHPQPPGDCRGGAREFFTPNRIMRDRVAVKGYKPVKTTAGMYSVFKQLPN